MSESRLIALAGNPNAGKTTMFNALTGARQHVGNYPGITVEKKEGFVRAGEVDLHIVDLPGTYSLTAYSQEELVARNFLVEERPDLVVDVLNAGALERNLYLAVQFMELGIPMVLALNMVDEAKRKGMDIDTGLLSRKLGVPVVETVARSGVGKEALIATMLEHAREEGGEWKPLHISYGPDLDPVLQEMTLRIEKENFLTSRFPARWVALKYLEGDEEIRVLGRKTGPLSQVLEQMVEQVAAHCMNTLKTYPEAIIADYRYGFITSVLRDGVITRRHSIDRIVVSDRMDRVLTHKFFGPVFMFLILFAIYQFTFKLGEIPMGWTEGLFGWLGIVMTRILPEGLFQSLVVSGVIDGVGGVLSFVPLILLMFLCIAFLEDSGYMARVAYMLDRVFRIFGLHGCSVMPLIVSGGIAGGCAVPGVMASRTLRSPREKLATLLTVPFMACGAKLPVLILLVGAFFHRHEALVLFLATLLGWVAALLVARVLRSSIIRGEATPFVMELPPYRWPTLKGVLIHTWERTWQYIKKAGTIILAISILLWALMTFPGLPQDRVDFYEKRAAAILDQSQMRSQESDPARSEVAQRLDSLHAKRAEESLRHSLAGRMGIALESVTQWAGFEWRTNIALVGGIAAKEVIVSTLGTAYSMGEIDPEDTRPLEARLAGDPQWNQWRAAALMAFIMLYAPCFVTVVAIARETGRWRWALFSVIFNTVLAFALATAIYQTGRLMGAA
ncbi:MAG: ferrous iron transport protein B [Desulfovibrionales bacterium]